MRSFERGERYSSPRRRFRLPPFPRIAHLCWNPNAANDDLVSSEFECQKVLLSENVYITEKMDGSQCAICFLEDNFLIRNKNHTLHKGFVGKTPSEMQFKSVFQYAHNTNDRFKRLNKIGGFRDSLPAVLYGEWMYMRHGIAYDALGDLFYVYDILAGKRFLPQNESHEMLAEAGFSVVPKLFQGKVKSVDFLVSLCQEQSAFVLEDDRRREGICLTVENERFKMVRSDFQPGLYFCNSVMRNEIKGI